MRLVIAILFALAVPLSALAADELTTKPSKYSVKETVDRLTGALKDKGISPAARIDHAAAAKAAGLELKATEVLMFGNPKHQCSPDQDRRAQLTWSTISKICIFSRTGR